MAASQGIPNANVGDLIHSRRDPGPVPRRRGGEHHWQREARGPWLGIDGYERKLLEVLHRSGSQTAQGEAVQDKELLYGAVTLHSSANYPYIGAEVRHSSFS